VKKLIVINKFLVKKNIILSNWFWFTLPVKFYINKIPFDPAFFGVEVILTIKLEVRAFKTKDKVIW
jgi:hypothetical protein